MNVCRAAGHNRGGELLNTVHRVVRVLLNNVSFNEWMKRSLPCIYFPVFAVYVSLAYLLWFACLSLNARPRRVGRKSLENCLHI